MDDQNDGLDGASSQPIEHHIHESYEEFEGNTDVENESTEQSSAKSKKLTSEAWTYFDLVHVNGVQMAKCKTCKKILSYKRKIDGSTYLAVNEKPKKVVFDQEVSRKELMKMVVMHEYPLSMVDHIGFRNFVRSLNDNFKMISRNTLKNDVIKTYNTERSSLKVLLERNEGRIAITTDMFTRHETVTKRKSIVFENENIR
ncbi:zinc finger BED domain-containing protein DAYSLEEPER-like [Amaranthus tricolor]|uniref:zinc finger BED domain-containing protein DAYSLEEPER-like n=1 Tax=Amaranthus tricolor TaxID=29722 RepID=UPI002585AA1D|nr:zinc finger BED domain-containing protein DAYSLEEPER-like [Amaranthus tricolor]